MKISKDSIAIAKEFDALRKANDPYFAVTEMEFQSAFDIPNGPSRPITLTVELLKNGNKTVKECADEIEKEERAVIVGLGIKEEILAEGEDEIIFLGERYLVRYAKTKSLGNVREQCRLYLVKDSHLVILTYVHLSNYFILNHTFDGFSALNGDDSTSVCSKCGNEIIYEVVAAEVATCLNCRFGI